MLEEGVEPSTGRAAHGDLGAARLPFTPPQRNLSDELRGKDSNLHSLFQRQASSPLDDPGTKRTRHDSNVRPQAPQACALILLSYGFRGSDE